MTRIGFDGTGIKKLWYKIRWWRGWRILTPVRVVGLSILSASAYVTMLKYGFNWQEIIEDFFANIISEMIGIVFAVLVIDALYEHRAKNDYKRSIIQQMSSSVNNVVLEAIRIAQREGWLKDGTLKKAMLIGANLQQAGLLQANMPEAGLFYANMEQVIFREANLQGAYLSFANLEWADLIKVNLIGARMGFANLKHARMQGANLQGADLAYSRLEGAEQFDEDTTLPDGTKWTPDTDMARFTDPNHPNFWSPPEDRE